MRVVVGVALEMGQGELKRKDAFKQLNHPKVHQPFTPFYFYTFTRACHFFSVGRFPPSNWFSQRGSAAAARSGS